MKKSLIFFILVFAFSISLVYAESCYIRLEINETFKNNVTSFSLLTQENLYGNYDGLVYLYDLGVGSPYILNVYSSQVEKYGLESSRFMFYDNFNDTENLFCQTCGNVVHKKCIEKWLETNHNCIFCRSDIWKDYGKKIKYIKL